MGIRGRTVDLYVRFVDAAGNRVNTDDTPTVTITDAGGNVLQSASDTGVSLYDDPGIYKLSYEIPDTAEDGYAVDLWAAEIGSQAVTASFNFLITSSGQIIQDQEQTYTPGDDIDFGFSEAEVEGINILLKILKRRLKSSGTRKISDGAGGFIDSVCDVFSDDELVAFLVNSLSEFNGVPHFTTFTFADPSISGIFSAIIIQGAVLYALSAQALIEKGREFTITDNGLSFSPPAVSEMLNSQFTTQFTAYKEQLKFIKCSLKPRAIGQGTFRVTSIAPAYLRLRHLRGRQII